MCILSLSLFDSFNLTSKFLLQVSITDVLKLSYEPGPLDLGSGLPFSGTGKSSSSNPDWATKVKEWQTAEQLTRMRDEEPILKNGGDRKFNELCVVCGDKASGKYSELKSYKAYYSVVLVVKYFSYVLCMYTT